MSYKMDKALQSVIDLHVLIENVFTGHGENKSLNQLLESFDNDFKMVTIGGARIGLAEVSSLFSQNIGKKPTLKITLQDITPLYELENYCWIQYQEHQQADCTETLRTSVVCIKVESEKCDWVYLHETPVLNK